MKYTPLVMGQKILILIMSLVTACLCRAQSKPQLIEQLQHWRAEISLQNELDDQEKDLRIDYVNRLIFQTEKNYESGENFRSFLQKTLQDFNDVDQMSSNRSFINNQYFNENLITSLTEVLEPTEEIIPFLRSYMNYSGLSDPASASEFGTSRSYINGDQFVAAEPMDVDSASEYLEIKEKREEEDLDKIPFKLSSEAYQLMPSDWTFENSMTP